MSVVLTMPLPSEPGADRLVDAAAHAEHDKDRVVLTREGKAVAAVVPIEDLGPWKPPKTNKTPGSPLRRWRSGKPRGGRSAAPTRTCSHAMALRPKPGDMDHSILPGS